MIPSLLKPQLGPTWTFLLNSLHFHGWFWQFINAPSVSSGGRVFLASNLDAKLLQPLEAPDIC